MTEDEIISIRLRNQQLVNASLRDPIDIVRWLGAVQSQDYAGGKWGLASRSGGITDETIDKLFDDGKILRTHVLRPTWHFVLPEDIRWMIELTEPRITAFSSKYFSDLGLDKSVLKRSNRIIVKAFEQSEFLTKNDLAIALEKGKVDTSDLRLTHLIFRAELDRLICSGPRRGKQQTYALFDQRAPNARVLKRDEALGELAIRYFTSRGPATVKDFGWWSGLNAADSRKAVDIVKSLFLQEVMNGETFYFSSHVNGDMKKKKQVHLLPAWDEYTVAYKDRSLVIDPRFESSSGHGIFSPIVVVDGRIKGTWRRDLKPGSVEVEVKYFTALSKQSREKVKATAKLYADFLNRKLVLKLAQA